MELNVAALREVLDMLEECFPWAESEEGYDYWHEVYSKIEEYYNDGLNS